MSQPELHNKFYGKAVQLLQSAREKVVQAVNHTMVETYYEIGKMIVEEEQDGKQRAEYGKELLKGLSNVLTKEFGKGFSITNLKQMRSFYQIYGKGQTVSDGSKTKSSTLLSKSEKKEKQQTPSDESKKAQTLSAQFKLSWSHYLKLMRIDDIKERQFYEIEAAKNNWSVRELQRQYDSALYTRLSLSRNESEVKKLSEQGLIIEKAKDAIKDPYILEFLGLPEHSTYTENDLETELIDKLEHSYSN